MINILLIDDSKLARKRMVQTIEELDIKTNIVGQAVDGEDGLKQYIQLQPNLIITDIEMPKMNGVKFVEEIRKLDKTVDIIVVSSIASEPIKKTIASDNFTYFIKKPIDENLLNITFRKVKHNITKKD